MLRRNNNVTSILLSDVTKLSSALPALGALVSDSNLEKGAVVLTTVGLTRTTLDLLADGDRFFIIQGKGIGVPLMKSPILTKGQIYITTSKHKPAQQQITIVGYNPNTSTGSLPIANETAFFAKVRKNDNDAANRSQPESLYAQYKTDVSGTQEELAFGIVKNGNLNMKGQVGGYAKYEVTSNGTAAVVTDATQTQDAIVVNGSNIITLVDTGTTTAGNTAGILASIPIGSILNIAGSTYKVESLTNNTVKLNIPYQGTSGTITGGTTVASQFSKLTTVTNYGFRVTGIATPFNVNKFRDYFANRFTVTFSDPDTPVSHIQGASNGNGVWQQVAMDEYMNYGFEGQNEMLAMPPTNRDQEVKIPGIGGNTALTSKYSAINIEWKETILGLTGFDAAKGNVLVYLNLLDSSGTGLLDTATANTGETLALALKLNPTDLNE